MADDVEKALEEIGLKPAAVLDYGVTRAKMLSLTFSWSEQEPTGTYYLISEEKLKALIERMNDDKSFEKDINL